MDLATGNTTELPLGEGIFFLTMYHGRRLAALCVVGRGCGHIMELPCGEGVFF
jgi:hypothetical protein